MGDKPKAKAFNRKPVDKRLVRQVMIGQKTPKYWVPMDISDTECKIMEVLDQTMEKVNRNFSIDQEIFCCPF